MILKEIFLREAVNATDKYTVAIDMDGVLADFSTGAKEMLGLDKDTADVRTFWSTLSRYDKNEQKFFLNLPVMEDAFDLMRFVHQNFKNYYILTASGYTPKDAPEQKREWVKKVFGPQIRVEVVKRSSDKANFADERSILVDDRMHSIGPWRSAGGIGILHTSAAQSIAELKPFLN